MHNHFRPSSSPGTAFVLSAPAHASNIPSPVNAPEWLGMNFPLWAMLWAPSFPLTYSRGKRWADLSKALAKESGRFLNVSLRNRACMKRLFLIFHCRQPLDFISRPEPLESPPSARDFFKKILSILICFEPYRARKYKLRGCRFFSAMSVAHLTLTNDLISTKRYKK